MELYHGSLEIVKEPNIDVQNYKTDFGKGFYTTLDFNQAKRWTKIKKDRIIKENPNIKVKRYVNVYGYTYNSDLNTIEFKSADEKWLDFIYMNRNSDSLLHNHDIISGPVANDNLFATLKLFESNYISKEETIKALKSYKLINQISFHTNEALKTIRFIRAEEIEDDE